MILMIFTKIQTKNAKILLIFLAIHEKIRDEKLQHNINKETPKILALRSGKIDKHEYLTDEEVLPSD